MHRMEAIEIIEKYIEGKLEGDALISFETRLQTDTEFRKEVEETKILINEIKRASEKRFAGKVKEWESRAQLIEKATAASIQSERGSGASKAKEDTAPEPGMGPGRKWAFVAIPSAAAMLLLAFWLIPSLMTPDPAQLYAANFKPYPDLYTQMSESTDPVQEAIEPYNEGDYASAVESFEEILQKQADDYLVKLYLGVSLMESQKAPAALTVFDDIIENDLNYKEAAEWYKALTYLKANQVEQSKAQLEIILAQKGHDYHKRAAKLLNKM